MEVITVPPPTTPVPGSVPGPAGDAGPSVGVAGGPGAGVCAEVAAAAAWLRAAAGDASAAAELLGAGEAVVLAAAVEELSRTVEYLQLAAARAVERAHRQARTAGALVQPADQPPETAPEAAVFEEYRSAAEFLRARLRISIAEARRRLAQAAVLLPRTGLTGEPVPPVHEHLGAELAAGTVSGKAAGTITHALDHVRGLCPPETAARMEQDLTATAALNDQDFLVRTAQRWVAAIDQDGPEPSEEELRHRQGLFLRRRHRGLHHLEIFATDEQYEQITTVIHTATNPRTTTGEAAQRGVEGGSGGNDDPAGAGVPGVFDRRSRAQQLLDGLVAGCQAALAAGGLPATGGLRPQVMVTIGYQDLLNDLTTNHQAHGDGRNDGGTGGGAGRCVFTGPVTARSARRIACDAEVLPVVLGGQGQVLDVGRSARAFAPHQRKALVARDGGCTAPGCTVPAAWCEAHHVQWWSRGGPTGINNAALACAYHHHLLHKERWRISLRDGIPWWTPPPELDPTQTPGRNTYFRI
ncbi:HNH endonuclease [Paenarthrobacter sp. DKR-5]|uniref:HNH endonuclease signature motif containing protein n=1 Tax=Paenarthrobacter sp. DKR-5 TaxID=2835535 RepID=UPI001BDCB2A2|nr:HNH endonuclease signature motif containing protein [Paenarthrobacter sp. DKR-5]MBT1002282.1 HNH endonuclease [Paenarthrobacter sp. DKR-5]